MRLVTRGKKGIRREADLLSQGNEGYMMKLSIDENIKLLNYEKK